MAVRRAEVIYVGDASSIVRASREAASAVEGSTSKIDRAGARSAGNQEHFHARIRRSFLGMTASAAKAGAAISAAYISIEGAKKAIDATEEMASNTLKLHRVMGMTVKQASAWSAVAKVHGIQTTALGMAFGTLSKNAYAASTGYGKQQAALKGLGSTQADHLKALALITKGAGAQSDAFKAVGVSQSDLVKGSTNFQGLLDKVGKGFEKLPAGTDKTALAMKLFGRGWQTIVPMLREGEAGMSAQLKTANEMGATFGGKTVKSLEQFKLAQERAKYGTLGLQLAFGQYLAPVLTSVTTKFANFVQGMRNGTGAGGILAAKLKPVADALKAIFNNRDMSLGDKINAAFQLAVPKIMDAMATAAPRAAIAFVKAFSGAGIWGQFLTVGFLLKKMGAFGAAGSFAAKKFSEKYLATSTPEMAAAGAAGGEAAAASTGAAGAAAGGKFSMLFKGAFLRMIPVIGALVMAQPWFQKITGGDLTDAPVRDTNSGHRTFEAQLTAAHAQRKYDKAHGLPYLGPTDQQIAGTHGRSVFGSAASATDKVPALLYGLDALIAKLTAKMAAMQAGFDRSDARATKAGLIAAVKHARNEPLFTVSRNSSASGVDGMSLSGSSAGGGLAWAERMVGHFKESTGKNTGPELDRLQKTFGTHAAAWCAEFATTALVKAGAPAQIRTASVAQIRAWAEAGTHGFQKGVNAPMITRRAPRPGDLMMFGNEHVGVVESVKGGKVHTIEGNTSSGQVSRRTHNITEGDFARAKGVGGAGLAGTVRRGLLKAAKVPTGKLTVGQIRGLAYAAGFRGHDLDVAVAIAEAESRGDTTASNTNKNGSIDRGLFQINSVHGKQSTFNPVKNAKAAFDIFKARGSFKDWVTYNTGAFQKFMGHTGHGHGTFSTGSGSAGAFSFSRNTGRGGDISSAVKALKEFNLQAARAKKLAAIQFRINGLERLKAWRDALKGIASDLKGKVLDAVDAFQTKWEATFGVAFDKSASAALDTFDAQTQSMIENGPAAQALAALQAQEDAINTAAEDASNAQALQDAKMSGDPRAIAAAQAQIAETARQRGITAAQKAADAERTALETQRAADRQALEDKQAADRQAILDAETAAFKANLTIQLNAEMAQLKARKESYAQFAHDVDAILKAAGIAAITTDAGTEAVIAGGPGNGGVVKPKGSGIGWTWGGPNTIGAMAGRQWGSGHATGGLLNYDVIHRVGELGPENIVMSSGGPRVVQASQSGHGSSGGGGVNFYGPVTIGSTRAAAALADRWAIRARRG